MKPDILPAHSPPARHSKRGEERIISAEDDAARGSEAGGSAVRAKKADPTGRRTMKKRSDLEEAINTSFCPLQEIFHTFVLRGLVFRNVVAQGVRNVSEACKT